MNTPVSATTTAATKPAKIATSAASAVSSGFRIRMAPRLAQLAKSCTGDLESHPRWNRNRSYRSLHQLARLRIVVGLAFVDVHRVGRVAPEREIVGVRLPRFDNVFPHFGIFRIEHQSV